MQYDTTLSNEQIARMLDGIEPEWTLHEATRVGAGLHTVYRLGVGTPAGPKTAYLKANPPGKEPTIPLEARLLVGLEERTTIPVPTVYGVVEEGGDLPAPYVLTSAIPGESRSRTELESVPDSELRGLARQTGRYLADLHDVPAVEAFGFLAPAGPALAGSRPPADFAVRVVDPTDDWPECLKTWADGTLRELESTRFADVIPRAEPLLESQIDGLVGRFEPRVARVDQSIENVLVEDGEIRAFLDWEFTLAATPAYDLSCVVWSLAGGPYRMAPGASDRRPLVREALLEGYARPEVVEQFHANRSCYELLSLLRSMVHLEDWYGLFDLGDRVDAAAVELREELDSRL